MGKLQKLTDEQAVEYIRTKDREGYREIVARYQDKLMRYANYLVYYNNMEAADIVQNSFIKAFINLNSFDTRKKFSSWIYRIVHNEAMNAVARHRNELPILEGVDFEDGGSIIDNLSKEEVRARVNKCLSLLPPLYREPLVLFFIEEKSYEEISDILRLPTGTVGTRISRAKTLMEKICQTIQK